MAERGAVRTEILTLVRRFGPIKRGFLYEYLGRRAAVDAMLGRMRASGWVIIEGRGRDAIVTLNQEADLTKPLGYATPKRPQSMRPKCPACGQAIRRTRAQEA